MWWRRGPGQLGRSSKEMTDWCPQIAAFEDPIAPHLALDVDQILHCIGRLMIEASTYA